MDAAYRDAGHLLTRQSLQLNLPTVPVHDLAVKDDDLVLGGQTLFRRPCDGAPSRALLLTNVSEWPGRHWLRVRHGRTSYLPG